MFRLVKCEGCCYEANAQPSGEEYITCAKCPIFKVFNVKCTGETAYKEAEKLTSEVIERILFD